MYNTKRYSGFNEFYYSATKRLRSLFNEEDACIEHLSNEIFYEIFEYLDGCNIYDAFSNLNSRFQHLINHSSLLLNIDLRYSSNSPPEFYENSVIIPNKHRIISLHIRNQLASNNVLTNFIIDSLFIRLESIVIDDIAADNCIRLLVCLKSLPRLFSLMVHLNTRSSDDLKDIYPMIFSLPSLKYNKLSSLASIENRPTNIFAPLATIKQFSPIEYLVINHCCTLNELLSILCYTPQLRYLTCHSLTKSHDYVRIEKSMTLYSLTYISIDNPRVEFDEFEIFIRQLSNRIQVFRFRKSDNKIYLDVDRWKKLIIEHMPHLRIFNFEYLEYLNYFSEYTFFNTMIYWCTSPFWVERQWFVELKTDNNNIVYSIRPYRKTWLDIHPHAEIVTHFDQNINDNLARHVITPNQQENDRSLTKVQLTINDCPVSKQGQPFIAYFKPVFVIVQFTRLNINYHKISIGMLVSIIQLLPNLDSLKVSSLPRMESDWLLNKNIINNKITKVNLEKMIAVEQVHFLLYLCSFIQYLQVDCVKDTDLGILLRSVLNKASTSAPHLKSLCLCIPNVKEDTVHTLQKLIDTKKLLSNYMIKRIANNILLKWN